MPTVKTVAMIRDGETLAAGGADQTSSAVNLVDGYGGTLHIKITNGATAPTIAAQSQVQVSADDSEYYNFGGALVAGLDNNGVYSWSVDIPIGVKYLKTVAGSNTAQAVTIDEDITEVSAIT